MVTIHAHDWMSHRPAVTNEGIRTVCSLRRSVDRFARRPADVTCAVCTIRVVHRALERGLSVETREAWTWDSLGLPAAPAAKEGS